MLQTFCGSLIQAAEQRPDKPAMTLLLPNGAESITFGSMLAQIRALAYRLTCEEIDFGDRVAIVGENHPNWAITYLAILYRGAVAVPLDPAATVETLASFLDNSETKLAFVSPTASEKFNQVCAFRGRPVRTVSLRNESDEKGSASFGDWVKTPVPQSFIDAAPPAQASDIALLIYTSGTTGVPKAVPLTHGNIHAEVAGVQEVMKLSDQEVILSLLPLFHAYSQIVNLWLGTVIGARIVYLNEVNPDEIARGLKAGGITTLTGVPRLWYLFHKKIFDAVRAQPRAVRWFFRSMLKANGWLRDHFAVNAGRLLFHRVHREFGGKLRLAISAGSSFDPAVAVDYHRLGFTILQGYGLTETAGAATVTRFEDNRVGSVGTPLNNVSVKIDAPNQEGVGEVLIRGPIVMSGYYRNPTANSEAFTTDGWFRSGDLGRFDAEGHLYIVGRKKDVIVLSSGKNVYPEDVEAHYSRSPLVGEICVLGIRNGEGGFAASEKLCAVIVPDFEYLKQQHIANAREAIRFDLDNLGRALPEYQRVREYLVQAEPLPRTATRKVRRFELQSQIQSSVNGAKMARDNSRFSFTAADHEMLSSKEGKVLVAAILRHQPDAGQIHPQMNLELDLGLDSLARAECIASLEQALGVEVDDKLAAQALSVGDVLLLVRDGKGNLDVGFPADGENHLAREQDWSELVDNDQESESELDSILRPKVATVLLAFVLLRLVYLFARVFLRMEVVGRHHLTTLEKPFIVCPNHQSYLDPLLVCSVYPYRILREIFHVGASEYWNNFFTKQLARMINIVPVDPDTNLRKAMRVGAAGLRAGKVLNIYPEGERSFDGELHRFKTGAAILASGLQIPIVPVALDGVYKVWPRKSWRLRLAKVRIAFGEPIYATRSVDGPENQRQQLTASVRARIEGMLAQMRS